MASPSFIFYKERWLFFFVLKRLATNKPGMRAAPAAIIISPPPNFLGVMVSSGILGRKKMHFLSVPVTADVVQ